MLGAAGLLLAGCAGSGAPAGPTATQTTPASSPELAALIEEAKAEGALDLVWGEGVLGGSEGAPLLIDGFRAYYGLDAAFPVNYTPGPPFTQTAATLSQEVATGQTASGGDVYLGYAPQWATLQSAPVPAFEETDWAWATNIPAEAIAPGGIGVAITTSFPVITLNSTAVTDPPSAMADLLDPKWKGRIASTPYASNFHYFAATIGEEEAIDYLTAFTDQVSGLMPCTQHDRLMSGEFDIFAFDCDQNAVVRNERDGGPLRYVIPSDAAMLTNISLGVPVNAAHPAAAKLWINYLLTRAAQDILWETYGSDLIWVEGSHTAQKVAELEADGVEFENWDFAAVLDSGRFPSGEFIGRMVAILTGAS